MMTHRDWLSRVSLTVLLAGLVLAPVGHALAQEAEEPAITLEAAPTHPDADAIDPDKLQVAAQAALRNAIASLAARQLAEGNETDLVFPPINRRTVVDHKEVTRTYSRKTVTRTRPVYKNYYEMRLAPKKNKYGHIVGYEKRKVLTKRVKIGEKKVTRERLVRDPDGPIKRTHRRRIYGKGGPDYVPRGLIGLNSMALYVMTKAGLAEDDIARDLADALAERIETYHLPDHTFDLAWATAAFAALPFSQHDELHTRLASKLIDGQVREREAMGMWGTVAIHYDLLARFFLTEVKLYQEIDPLQSKLEAVNKSLQEGQSSRSDKRLKMMLERKVAQHQEVLDQVIKGLNYASVLGKRFAKSTREYRPGSEWGKAGLPYYVFNRIVADTQSTSLAAFALAESARAEKLPDMTLRVKPAGRQIVPPENTRAALMQALRRIVQQQQRHGGWEEGNLVVRNRAFDRYRNLGIQDVPLRENLPDVPSLETIRSNVDGYAALGGLLEAWGDRAPAGFVGARERSIDHVLATLEAFASKPMELSEKMLAYGEETDTAQEVRNNAGFIQTRANPVSDPKEMPVGFLEGGYDLMRSAAFALRTVAEGSTEHDDRVEALRRRLAYRLLLSQGGDGQWSGWSSGLPITSAMRQYYVYRKLPRLYEWLEKHEDKERTPNWWRNDRRRHILGQMNDRDNRAPRDLYPTLAASLVLLELVDEPVALEGVTILPPEPEDEEEAGDESIEDAGEEGAVEEEPEPLDPEKAASEVERLNEALLPLIEAVLDAQDVGENRDGEGAAPQEG